MHKKMTHNELNRRLKKHERSQGWLARKINTSAMCISKWSNNQMPISTERARQIRNLLP
tara:strand:- start:37 stop:213 length:177 start_codon:yes stop_codon:yes gene_type:complete